MTIRYAIAFRVWSRRRILGGYRSAPRTSSRARSAGHRWRRSPASTDEPRAGIALDLATAQNYAPESSRRSRSSAGGSRHPQRGGLDEGRDLARAAQIPLLLLDGADDPPLARGQGDIVLAVIRASGVAEGADRAGRFEAVAGLLVEAVVPVPEFAAALRLRLRGGHDRNGAGHERDERNGADGHGRDPLFARTTPMRTRL